MKLEHFQKTVPYPDSLNDTGDTLNYYFDSVPASSELFSFRGDTLKSNLGLSPSSANIISFPKTLYESEYIYNDNLWNKFTGHNTIGIFKATTNRCVSPEDLTTWTGTSVGYSVLTPHYWNGKRFTALISSGAGTYYEVIKASTLASTAVHSITLIAKKGTAAVCSFGYTDTGRTVWRWKVSITWATPIVALDSGSATIVSQKFYASNTICEVQILWTPTLATDQLQINANNAAGVGSTLYTGIQIETSDYPTPYTSSPFSTSIGKLYYPISLTSPMSFELWFRPWFTYNTSTFHIIAFWGASNSSDRVMLYYDMSYDKFCAMLIKAGDVIYKHTFSTTAFTTNTSLWRWFHLKVNARISTSTIQLYQDGILQTGTDIAPVGDVTTVSPSTYFVIGCDTTSSNYPANGLFNDVLVRTVGDSSNTHFAINKPYFDSNIDNPILNFQYDALPTGAEVFSFRNQSLVSSKGRKPIPEISYFPGVIDGYNNQWSKFTGQDTVGVFKATTNLVANPEDLTAGIWTNISSTDAMSSYYFQGQRFTQIIGNNTAAYALVYQTVTVAAGVNSFQVKIKKGLATSTDADTYLYFRFTDAFPTTRLEIRVNWDGTYVVSTGTLVSLKKYGDVIEILCTSTSCAVGPGSLDIAPIRRAAGNIAATEYGYATAVQVENSTFPTPYVPVARQAGINRYHSFTVPIIGTFELWIRPWSTYNGSTWRHAIVLGGSVAPLERVLLQYNENTSKWEAYIYDGIGSNYRASISTTGYASNAAFWTWHHLKVVWNIPAQTIELYQNGVFQTGSSTLGTVSTFAPSSVLSIGTGHDAIPNSWIDAQITDFCIQSVGDTSRTHYDSGLPYYDPLNDSVVYGDTIPVGGELFSLRQKHCYSSSGRYPTVAEYLPATYTGDTKFYNQWNKFTGRSAAGVFQNSSNLVLDPEDLTTANWTNEGSGDSITNLYWNNKRFTRIIGTNTLTYARVHQHITIAAGTVSVIVTFKRGNTTAALSSTIFNVEFYDSAASLKLQISLLWDGTTSIGDGSIASVKWYGDVCEAHLITTSAASGIGTLYISAIQRTSGGNVPVTDYGYATGIQLEQLPYPTPYINQTYKRYSQRIRYDYTWPTSGVIEFWAKSFSSVTSGYYPALFDTGYYPGTASPFARLVCWIASADNTIRLLLAKDSTANYMYNYGTITTATLRSWTHYKIIYDYTIPYIRLLVNGSMATTFTVNGTMTGITAIQPNLVIGLLFESTQKFDGLISDFTIYPISSPLDHYKKNKPYYSTSSRLIGENCSWKI